MIRSRSSLVSTALLALALVGCALPGLGARPLPAVVPAYEPRVQEEKLPAAPTVQPAALDESGTSTPSRSQPSPAPPDSQPATTPSAVQPQPTLPVIATAPARLPGLAASSFSLAAVEPAPAGILPQVNVFQTGGGSGYNGADCDSQPGVLRWCRPLNGADLALTSEFRGIACGWVDLPLKATLRLPDGTTQPALVQGDPPYCREIIINPSPGALPGHYEVTVEQGGAALVDTFQWVRPARPSGIRFQGCAWLEGLTPNQPVRLQVFGRVPPDSNSDPTLGAWRYLVERRFSATPGGALWACPDQAAQNRFPELAYLAYLPSGAPLPMGEEDLLRQFQGICADGPPTRLAVGKSIRTQAKTLPIFPDPALEERPLDGLAAGTKATIVNDPVCPPQGPWTWKVSLENGLTGWIAESDTTSYFVEPVR